MSNPLVPLFLFVASATVAAELRAEPVDAGRRKAAAELAASLPTTITVPLGGTVQLHLASARGSKAPLIGRVDIEKSGILDVRPAVNDQATVIVRGIALGITRLELTTLDGKQRATYEIVVEQDMAYLNYLLKRVVPTASVKPISVGGNTIVLTGTVRRAEDIETILAITRAYSGR